MNVSVVAGARGDVVVISTPQFIDTVEARELRQLMDTEVAKGNFRIVVNLADTTYMGSRGIGALVSHIADTRKNNGDVRLASPGEQVSENLQITNLVQILKIFSTVDEAVASFA